MPGLPLYWLIPARLLPVSYRAVRPSLDALDHRRVSRSECPFHFPPSTKHAAYLRGVAWLSRGYRLAGDPGGRSIVPLPAGVQSTRAPADQMGGLRVRCAYHLHISRKRAAPKVTLFPYATI